jgi:hypothetical protein
VTAVRGLTRHLRERELLDARIRPVAQLALTSAGLVDAAAGGQVKPYAQANLLRAHAAILTTLIGLAASDTDEAMDALLEALRSPLGYASPMGDAVVDEDSYRIPGQVPPWMRLEGGSTP